MHADDDSFFDDATFSDVKIKFSGQEILAHKNVLSRKCEYFFKAFTGNFSVGLNWLNLMQAMANILPRSLAAVK